VTASARANARTSQEIDLDRTPTTAAFRGYIAKYARLVFPLDLRWCNPRRSVQGSVMAVYADEAVGYAMMAPYPDLKTVWTTDVPPLLSSTAVWSPIPQLKEIGREEALFRRTDHRLPA
jgi:hypothetical protein